MKFLVVCGVGSYRGMIMFWRILTLLGFLAGGVGGNSHAATIFW